MESIPSEVKEIGHGISKDGKKMQSSHVYDKSGVSPTLTTGTGGNHQPLITESCQAVLTPDREEKRQNGRRMKDDGEPMFILTAQDRHGVAIQFTRKSIPKEVDVANTLVAATPKKALGNNSPITAVLTDINVIGNYHNSKHNASRVISTDGIAPTVMENHGTVTAVVINDGREDGKLQG